MTELHLNYETVAPYPVTIDSGIVNDANDWAVDTMKNPRYPLELFQRVITVSLKTMKRSSKACRGWRFENMQLSD